MIRPCTIKKVLLYKSQHETWDKHLPLYQNYGTNIYKLQNPCFSSFLPSFTPNFLFTKQKAFRSNSSNAASRRCQRHNTRPRAGPRCSAALPSASWASGRRARRSIDKERPRWRGRWSEERSSSSWWWMVFSWVLGGVTILLFSYLTEISRVPLDEESVFRVINHKCYCKPVLKVPVLR